MPEQSMPVVSKADVERIIRRDFEAARVEEVQAMLEECDGESGQEKSPRVHLAALKLAAGCVDQLHLQIETAKCEYRDVLAPAEYPGYMQLRPRRNGHTSDEVQRVTGEKIEIAPYDPTWPESFRHEKKHLLSCLPEKLVGRIEHFGSTAIPGLAAKPIIDMFVEVADLKATRTEIAPLLEAQDYDYFWRPTHGDDGPPFYAWFIKRDAQTAVRTHHIHMVERSFIGHWDRLLFRDYLIAHAKVAREYQALKVRLAAASSHDRVAYTRGKSEFIERVTADARQFYAGNQPESET